MEADYFSSPFYHISPFIMSYLLCEDALASLWFCNFVSGVVCFYGNLHIP